MGYLMKGKKSWKDCGTILNKVAKGENYTWGLRFYKLLIECFRSWDAIDVSKNISESWNKLKVAVPICEDIIYYEYPADELPRRHKKLNELYNEDEGEIEKEASLKNQSDLYNKIDRELNDFRGLKQEYLDQLYEEYYDEEKIKDAQINFENFYDNRAEILAENIVSQGQKVNS